MEYISYQEMASLSMSKLIEHIRLWGKVTVHVQFEYYLAQGDFTGDLDSLVSVLT